MADAPDTSPSYVVSNVNFRNLWPSRRNMSNEKSGARQSRVGSYMEFGSPRNKRSLRTMLRRLAVLSQAHCSELDKARLNILSEVKTVQVFKIVAHTLAATVLAFHNLLSYSGVDQRKC
jgi:hypothetical protein